MLVLQNQLLHWVLSTSDQCFVVSFQPILCHPHTQISTILSHDERRDIPNLEFSPIHVSIGLSQIAFPTRVLPKDDHIDFAQKERLGLPYWIMILAICVVIDEPTRLDIAIFHFHLGITALPENRPSRELPFPKPPSPCVECGIVLADHAPEAGLAPGIFHEISRQTPWQKSKTWRNGLEEEITCTALMRWSEMTRTKPLNQMLQCEHMGAMHLKTVRSVLKLRSVHVNVHCDVHAICHNGLKNVDCAWKYTQ